ncbi:MAG: S8 family serine peptidase, partial [Candidatus Sifarchaeia archaeon]
MNNLRKTVVLLFIGVLAISMALVPFTPFANNDSQVAAPTDYQRDFVEKWADRLENDFMAERVDPILVSYMETGVLDGKVVTTRSGDTKLLLYIEPAFDINALAGIAKVRWQIDLKLTRVASVEISSIAALKQLDAMGGVRYIQADVFLEREPVSYNGDDKLPDMFNINDVVGATQANALGYNGSGVIVGVDDTGVDFSQMDMWGTEYNNGTHPMSYDPSSYGLTEMYLANNTFVENTTAWLEAGNLLTYELGGKYYLNVSGWDPVLNNIGGHRNLLGLLPPYGDGYPYGSVIGFIGLYEWAWGPVNNVSEFVYHEMWKDWEIPAPGAENYTFGWAFQQRTAGYVKTFATSMYYEGNIVIDWNSSLGWTTMWQNALNLQNIDLNTTADRNAILAMMDWSFKDDYDDGFVFNRVNNVLYADGLVDGSHSMGLGSLSWAYDGLGYLAHDPGLFCGYTDDGMIWNALFPGGDTGNSENHGHWTAATVASQGTYAHDVYGNGTTYNLPGVAPGAKIIATKGLSTGGDLMADFWAAGFHLNETSGYWDYITDGPSHRAHIVSNSWGWGPGASYLQMRLFTMIYDIASVPDVLKTGYPGTLFVFSAGNHGGDYGTMGTPGGSFSVISVGGTITSHFYQSLYSQYPQTDSQHIWFAGMGPTYTGAVKPDVVAPGYRGVNPQPGQSDWLYPNDPDFNEDYDTYFWWQGTSL